MRWFEKIGLLLSQALNALAFDGDPDESLSARAWRQQRVKWVARIYAVIGAGHCRAVHLKQMAREARRKTPS